MKYIEKNNKKIALIEMNNFKKKLIGLMFKKDKIKKAYFFKNTNGIHTFFMKQNIDVLYLDKDYKIIKIDSNLKPNKIVLPSKNIKHTIEMPESTSTNFIVGEILTIKEK